VNPNDSIRPSRLEILEDISEETDGDLYFSSTSDTPSHMNVVLEMESDFLGYSRGSISTNPPWPLGDPPSRRRPLMAVQPRPRPADPTRGGFHGTRMVEVSSARQ